MAVSGASTARHPASGAPSHNLPSRLTSFIGREREIAEVAAQVRAERLVSLVGAPGVGKTRLGLQVAAGLLDDFPDGVWLIELAPLADAELVPHAVASVLGVHEQPGHTMTVTLAGYLRSRKLLLLLDNCEHLVEACATLADVLLRSCPSLHVLATSREPLAIDGEVTRRVPSLSVPERTAQVDRANASDDVCDDVPESMRLFVDRARAASASFALNERTAPLVGQICAGLDGIPLAIELAAARVRALSVDQIAARLDDRFRLLTGGSRTALPRQRTLRGAVDWSYHLLPEPEQALLRRLAVFAGGFTLGAGCWVSGFGGEDEHHVTPDTQNPKPETLDQLVSLVDKSLVQVEEGIGGEGGEHRYRLLETFREYGLEKLAEHAELEEARDRHRDYFLAFVENADPPLIGPEQKEALARLEREHDNFRAALDWCLAEAAEREPAVPSRSAAASAAGIRLAAALYRFWWFRSLLSEGRHWIERMLAVQPSARRPAELSAQAAACFGVAQIASSQGEYRAAAGHMNRALALFRRTGDESGAAQATVRIGAYSAMLGDPERARRFCQEGVMLARQLGDTFTLAVALHASANNAWVLGQYDENAVFAEEAAALWRELGAPVQLAYTIRSLSRAVRELGDRDRSSVLAKEAYDISQNAGDARGIAESLKDLGYFALLDGDPIQATALLRPSVSIYQELGLRSLGVTCLYGLAGVSTLAGSHALSRPVADPASLADARDHFSAAARLFAAAEHLRSLDGLTSPADLRGTYDRDVAATRDGLGEAAFEQAWAEGPDHVVRAGRRVRAGDHRALKTGTGRSGG